MVTFPSTLPSPLLASGTTTSQVSSKTIVFDYRSRIVRVPPKKQQSQVSFAVNDAQLQTFIDFYNSIKVDHFLFYADWFIHASDNVNKTFRIISQPSVTSQGGFRYNISFNIETVDNGTLRTQTCPLYTFATLTTSNTLTTC